MKFCSVVSEELHWQTVWWTDGLTDRTKTICLPTSGGRHNSKGPLDWFLLLPIPYTDCLQQIEDYVRGCTTSTKYCLPSTNWRLCQRLYYFYQILTTFNKLKMISEVILLLPNTDRLQQIEDYVRGYTTSTKYWPPSINWRWYQRLYYFYQILTAFNKLKIIL